MVATFATSKLSANSMLALRLAATADGGSVPVRATEDAEVKATGAPPAQNGTHVQFSYAQLVPLVRYG